MRRAWAIVAVHDASGRLVAARRFTALQGRGEVDRYVAEVEHRPDRSATVSTLEEEG